MINTDEKLLDQLNQLERGILKREILKQDLRYQELHNGRIRKFIRRGDERLEILTTLGGC